MAVFLQLSFLMLLLSGQGFCQCFIGSDCRGDIVIAESKRDCCVLKDGASYNDVGTCKACKGMILAVYIVHRHTTNIVQFMDSVRQLMMLKKVTH